MEIAEKRKRKTITYAIKLIPYKTLSKAISLSNISYVYANEA